MRTATTDVRSALQQCYRQSSYTPTGQIDTVADANGNLTKHVYDPLDRRAHTYYPSKK